MPRGDRTGPIGQGPMSGRGLGDCGGDNIIDNASQTPGRGYGMGWGGGRGFGWGGGNRRGGRFYAPTYRGSLNYFRPPVSLYDEGTEAKLLREQATRLKDALDKIEKRLDDLEKE